MTYERRNAITRLIFEVFAQRVARYGGSLKTNPIPHGNIVLALAANTDFTEQEVDHVLVQLCCRLLLNIIGGVVFCTADAPIGLSDSDGDDTIDWLYGSGRFAQER